MNIVEKHINEIRPYWRNPRKNDKAVEAVKASIEKYGYSSPIVVDAEGVIIAGHTRYKALRQLGYERFNVIILDLPKDKAKQYRIADNKAAEKAEWDDDLLMFELREIEELKDMTDFFNSGELDKFFDLDDVDFTPISAATFAETEAVVRAEVIQAMPVSASTETEESKKELYDREVQARVEAKMQEEARRQAELENERMKIRMREMEEENRKIREREQEMKEQFTVRSEERAADLVKVVCPHCLESYNLSKGELLRRDKFESA